MNFSLFSLVHLCLSLKLLRFVSSRLRTNSTVRFFCDAWNSRVYRGGRSLQRTINDHILLRISSKMSYITIAKGEQQGKVAAVVHKHASEMSDELRGKEKLLRAKKRLIAEVLNELSDVVPLPSDVRSLFYSVTLESNLCRPISFKPSPSFNPLLPNWSNNRRAPFIFRAFGRVIYARGFASD